MFLKSLFVLVIPFWASGVFAMSLAETYRAETKKVLMNLHQLGITEVACKSTNPKLECLKILELVDKVDQVNWLELDRFNKASSAPRLGAFYSPSQNTIYLNKSARHDSKFIGYVGMHELLGMAGVQEVDFNITTAAYQTVSIFGSEGKGLRIPWRFEGFKAAMLVIPSTSNLDLLDPEYGVLALDPGGGGGGVFVGGGGGDTRSFQLRMELYEHIHKYIPSLAAVDVVFANINIEVVDNSQSEIDYQVLGGFFLNRIFVPAWMLEQKSTRDPQVSFPVEDIAWFLASAHPDYAGAAYRGEPAYVEPLSLKGAHPQAIRKIWCIKNIFNRDPIAACHSLKTGRIFTGR